MASIPCATFQAGQVHAHMRRQDMRARHPSTASTDSAASEGILPTPPLNTASDMSGTNMQHVPSSRQSALSWERMERVSQWVGENMKKFRFSTDNKASQLGMVPENRVPPETESRPDSVVRLDT